jgi:TPR repeat protein
LRQNDTCAIHVLGNHYHHGDSGLQQNHAKAIELWTQAAELSSSEAHFQLGVNFDKEGEIRRKRSYTTMSQLWLDMMWQDATFEQWSLNQVKWNKL